MFFDLSRILLGLALSAFIGWFGYRRRSLSRSGVLGAILVGTAIVGFGGIAWGILLILFFASSSALSHYKEAQKESLAEKFSKGSQRDLAQALANGGTGAALALINVFLPHPILGNVPPPMLWAAFVGAMATVNADTWATELGVLSNARPRLVTNGKRVEAGTSGGVTPAGTLAATAGAMLIAAPGGIAAGQWALSTTYELMRLSPLYDPFPPEYVFGFAFYPVLFSGTLAGLLGSLFDSLLGATVQAMYFCPRCRKETERHPLHRCGENTFLLRGWRWLDNDWVNFVSSVFGAIVAATLYAIIPIANL